ncbi:MAG: efflux RND transporter permease subunit [Oligoflexus sp.]
MIESFVKRPAMTIMLVMVFVILGIYSYQNLIIERQPKVEFPIVTVQTIYPGASPVEIESQILEKIEDAVSEISEIETIRSDAFENFGVVVIEFLLEADVNVKASEVKDKVEAIINELPASAEQPIIAKFDPLVAPIVELILTSDELNERELYDYADQRLKDEFTRISGVASVELSGGKQRQINVDIDPFLMSQKYIVLGDVVREIRGANLNVPGGSLVRNYDEVSVRFEAEFQDIKEIENLMIVSNEGTSHRLSTFARVSDSHKDVESITRFNGENAVGLSINKLSDGDAVTIAQSLKQRIDELNEQMAQGLKITVAFDSTDSILKENNETIINILIGVGLTILILFSFLGNLRVTFIAAVVIPTSLVSTFLLMDFSNFSINFMTLLAMGTALGTLIANAIVIIESISALLDEGYSSTDAAIKGTKRVSFAVIASAGTNLVVFTPIAFMGGIVGKFMMSFGLTVVYATLFSILASFTLTPMLCALLLKPKSEQNQKNWLYCLGYPLQVLLVKPTEMLMKFLINEYRHLFHVMFKVPIVALIIALGIFISPFIFIMSYVGGEFISRTDVNMIQVKIERPQGTPIEQTLATIERVENVVKDVPEVISYLSRVGIDGVENATVTVNLEDRSERNRSDEEIIRAITPEMAKIPDAIVTLERGAGGPGGSMADVTVDVYGRDYETMVEISDKLRNIMLETGNFSTVVTTHKDPKEEIVFRPDRERIFQNGLSSAAIGTLIRNAVSGNEEVKFKDQGEEYDINVSVRDEYKTSIEDIGTLAIMAKGGLLPIEHFGDLSMTQSLPPLKRRDKQRLIQLGGNLARSTAAEVNQDLAKRFAEVEFPAGFGYRFSGNAENMEESGREIGKAFLLAVILTYMLLAAILNSFVHPFTIVSSVFTSFAGVFYGLFFLEFTINIGSMMAMVMLVGLAVNNAILLLDETFVQIDEGKSLQDALWQAAVNKFRAILMSSIAIISGTLPQVFDPAVTKASMGGVILGGVLASVLFTFILTPLVFYYLEKIRRWFNGLFAGKVAPADHTASTPSH